MLIKLGLEENDISEGLCVAISFKNDLVMGLLICRSVIAHLCEETG